MNHRWFALSAFLALGFGSCGRAGAAALVDSNFSGFQDGPLVGQGGWSQIGSDVGRPLTISGGALRIGSLPLSASITPYQSAVLPLPSPVSVGGAASEVDYGVLLSVTDVPAGPNETTRGFSLLTTSGSFANARVSIRQGTQPGTYQFGARHTGQSNVTTVFGGDLAIGEEVLLVGRLIMNPGSGNDVFQLFVDPPVSAEGVVDLSHPYATGTGGTDSGSVNAFSINQFTSTVSSQPGMDVFRIAVGTSAASVVPEPVAGMVSTTGVLALLTARARRRNA